MNLATSSYLIRPADLSAYLPANHLHTGNQHLIGAQNVGAKQMGVLLGAMHKGGAALPHAHPGIEQARCLLQGAAHVEVAGRSFARMAAEACFPSRSNACVYCHQ